MQIPITKKRTDPTRQQGLHMKWGIDEARRWLLLFSAIGWPAATIRDESRSCGLPLENHQSPLSFPADHPPVTCLPLKVASKKLLIARSTNLYIAIKEGRKHIDGLWFVINLHYFTSWPHEKKAAAITCAEPTGTLNSWQQHLREGQRKRQLLKPQGQTDQHFCYSLMFWSCREEILFIIIVSFSLTKRKSDGRFYDEEKCLLSLQ